MPHQPKHAKVSLEFTAKDWHHHPKNQFWYLGMGLMLAGFLVLALVFGQYLLAVVIVAVGVAIIRIGNLTPGARTIKLTTKGVTWGDRFFGYHQLRAFWVAEQADKTTLYLERLNLSPAISFVIPNHSAPQALAFLGSQLPYHSHKGEPLGDRLSRLLHL
ncbi:MAG TPA: hypothetical protein VLE93_00215 [Candidatus Saccharimonadales bacterium]|nr:hypothetical protein [Candidatus Saccharimonadales bacterium]